MGRTYTKKLEFPGSPVVRTPCFHCRGHGWVRSLVGELRSCMLSAVAKKQKSTVYVKFTLNWVSSLLFAKSGNAQYGGSESWLSELPTLSKHVNCNLRRVLSPLRETIALFSSLR